MGYLKRLLGYNTSMSHTPCPFILPNGTCSLPTCFEESSTSSSMSFFVDINQENGVFKVKMPNQSLVLYVPPVLVLLDAFHRATHCHVVASWWWSEQNTLFIQVHISHPTRPCSQNGHAKNWQVDHFPLTCVGKDGRYLIHTLHGALEKKKRKTE